MHLLWRDGRALEHPVPIPRDRSGALLLADLYAAPRNSPWVRAMMNTTIDGAVAGADGTSATLRNPDDSFVFTVLRSLCDVVMVGARTAREEDYSDVRGREDLAHPSRRPGGASRPALAILTTSGELPAGLDPRQPTYVLAPADRARSVRDAAVVPAEQVISAPSASAAIAALVRRRMTAIQLEGGPSILGPLAADGEIDELCFSISHRTVGGPSPRVLTGAAHDRGWQLASMIVGAEATISRYVRA